MAKQRKRKRLGIVNLKRNKERKKERHERNNAKTLAKSLEKDNLLQQLKTLFPNKTHSDLRKTFGILNLHRLKDIVAGTWLQSTWFRNRMSLKMAKKIASVQGAKNENHIKRTMFKKKPLSEKLKKNNSNPQS